MYKIISYNCFFMERGSTQKECKINQKGGIQKQKNTKRRYSNELINKNKLYFPSYMGSISFIFFLYCN